MQDVHTHASFSKFAFCDLALESALQLERARNGATWESAPLQQLADVLTQTAKPVSQAPPAAFIEAGYYEPYERLLRSQRVGESPSIERIREYVESAVDRLRAVRSEGSAPEAIMDLVNFCVSLHRELVRELAVEDNVVISEWRASGIPA